jgi:hypothetical protein
MEGANATLLAALSGADESRLTLMLAGHIHNFQIENYPGATAPQLVVGEGGDALDKEVPRQLAGLVSGGETVAAGLSIPGFGYVMLDRNRHTQDWGHNRPCRRRTCSAPLRTRVAEIKLRNSEPGAIARSR